MKYINFKNISIKNFLSIGKDPLILNFSPGIHFITGENLDKEDSKNGVGKSTIIDAIFFCLTGEPLRDIKKDNLSNWVHKKNSYVILEFDVNDNGTISSYKLTRTIGPSACSLYKDGSDISLSSMPKTTEFILNLLDTNNEVLRHNTLMSLNNAIPFMKLKKPDKRKFIEGILRLEILSDIASIVNKELNDHNKEKDITVAKMTELDKSILIYKNQKEKYDLIKENKIKEIQKEIDHNNEKIKDLLSKQKDIPKDRIKDILNILQNLNQQKTSLDDDLMKSKNELFVCNSQIKDFNNKISNIDENGCPQCNRPWSEEDKQHKIDLKKKWEDEMLSINNNISKLTSQINELTLNKTNISLQIKELENEIEEYSHWKSENSIIENRIENYKSNNILLEKNMQNVINENIDFDSIINDSISNIEKYRDDIKDISVKCQVGEATKFILSEEGVKSVLVKKFLTLLNAKFNTYLAELDANCTCKFNEYFEDDITTQTGMSVSYSNFSGGEMKRIDLASLFSFIDMRKMISGTHNNLLIFDELFDSCIDAKGTELILDILDKRVQKYNECIYIITHKKELAKNTKNVSIIELVKKQGFTYLKE